MSEIPQQQAGSIQFIGQSGQPRLQFPGVSPVPFDVGEAMPDRTQQLFQRVDQNLQAATQASMSVIQNNARAAGARAQARTQSGFASAVASIAESVTAGLTLYQENQQRQRSEEQTQLAGMLEREMRNQVINLYSTIEENGALEGEFVTFRQFTNELTQYANVLTTEQITALQDIGFDALEAVARNRATNKQELIQQTRDTAVQSKIVEIGLAIAQDGEVVAAGGEGITPQGFLDSITDRVNDLANTGNYSPLELMRIYNESMLAAEPYLSENIREQLNFDEKRTRSRSLIQRMILIQDDNTLTETQKAAEIAELQVEANAFDLGITLSSILPTQQEMLEQIAREQEFERQWQTNAVEHLLSTDANYAQSAADYALGHALSLIRSQNTARIESMRTSDNPLFRQVALEADALLAARERHQEWTVNRSREIDAEIKQYDVIIERARRRLNPTAALGTPRVTDPNVLRILNVIGEERGQISAEEADAIAQHAAAAVAALRHEKDAGSRETTVLWTEWFNRGIDIHNLEPANEENWQLRINNAQTYMDEAQARESERLIQLNAPQPRNFDNGVGITAPASTPLYTSPDGLTFPNGAEQGQPTVTSEYGLRSHPIHGTTRFHAGIDLVFDGPVRTIQGGEVISIHTGCDPNNSPNCGGGWGNFVSVRTPSGHVEHFSHLPPDLNVAVGQTLRPGDPVANSIASSGSSTGPHLDFAVFAPDAPENEVSAARAHEGNTINPRSYFAFVQNMEPTPNGAGLPVSQGVAPDGNYSAIARNFTLQEMFRYTPAHGGRIETAPDVYERPERVYNNSNVRANQGMSIHRTAYPETNNPEHNFGYDVLRVDNDFREAIAHTANRLNIPSMWLADVIEFESFFNPSEENSLGATGLIQFFPGAGLADVAQWMGTSEAQAKRRLKQMTRAQQMQYVERWLYRYGPSQGHQFESIVDLYGLVNQGPQYWNRKARGTHMGIRDGNNTLEQLLNKLGEDVGRRYNINSRRSQSRRIHSNHAHAGCPECSRMMANFGTILPHYETT